jgi:hypothetical protein
MLPFTFALHHARSTGAFITIFGRADELGSQAAKSVKIVIAWSLTDRV